MVSTTNRFSLDTKVSCSVEIYDIFFDQKKLYFGSDVGKPAMYHWKVFESDVQIFNLPELVLPKTTL